MRVQVLVATMNQPKEDYSLLEKMNIQTDAIVCNQCDRNEFLEFRWHGHNIRWISFAERGVGLNRNNALMRATGEIVVFADDDMVYEDDYGKNIVEAFEANPKTDALIFNILTIGGDQQRRMNNRIIRIHRYNSLNYGTARIAVRRDALVKKRICFSQLYGGGAAYSSGEDSLFISDMMRNRLKIYAIPIVIASVDQSTSTWFSGYHEKFFYDKGALMKAMFPRAYWLMNDIYFPLRYRNIAKKKMSYIRSWMNCGSKGYEKLEEYVTTDSI